MTCKNIIPRILMLSMVCSMFFFVPLALAKPFHIGYFLVKPHIMPTVDGQPRGVAVEYFKYIADEMGLSELKFSLFPLKRLLLELEQNRIDMAMLLAKNPERALKFVYPGQPFCLTRPSIVVNAASSLKTIRSVDDLLKLSIQESAGGFRSPFLRDHRLKIEPLHGTDYTMRCFSKLLTRRTDACYQPDHYPLEFEAMRGRSSPRVRILRFPEPPIGLYSVFSKQGAKTYLEPYETALDRVKQKISYKETFQAVIDRLSTF